MILDSRDEWQELAYKAWYNNKGNGLIEAVTGSGKTILSFRCLDELANSTKFEFKSFIVIVHNIAMKQQWETKLKEQGYKQDYKVIVINTACKNKYETDFVIYDEIDCYLGDVRFKVFDNIKTKFMIGLSGTLLRTEKFNKLYAKYKIVYTYPINEAIEKKAVSDLTVYNLAIQATEEDEMMFKRWRNEYDKYIHFFDNDYTLVTKCLPNQNEKSNYIAANTRLKLAKEANVDEKVILGYAVAINKIVAERKRYLDTYPTKINIAIQLIEKFKDKKIITFSQLTEISDSLGELTNSPVIHSKMTTEEISTNFNLFVNNKIRCLHSVKKLQRGLDVPDSSFGIVVNFDSSTATTEQIVGRFIRKSDGKAKGIVVFIYLKSKFTSQDEKWLKKAQARLTERVGGKIKYINTIEEIC